MGMSLIKIKPHKRNRKGKRKSREQNKKKNKMRGKIKLNKLSKFALISRLLIRLKVGCRFS